MAALLRCSVQLRSGAGDVTGRIQEPPEDLETLRSAAGKAVAERGLRPVAREIGLSPTGLKFVVNLPERHPYSPTLRRLRKWYAKHATQEDG